MGYGGRSKHGLELRGRLNDEEIREGGHEWTWLSQEEGSGSLFEMRGILECAGRQFRYFGRKGEASPRHDDAA